MNQEKKELTKKRSDYNNLDSYDDELAIVLDLLRHSKRVENQLLRDFEREVKKFWNIYKQEFPFYFKNGVVNEERLQALIIALATNGSGSINTRLSDAIEELTRETRHLQKQRLMSWLILDYEMTASKTAKSLGQNPKQYKETLLAPKAIEEKVNKPWCKDNKTVLDRINANVQDFDDKLKLVITRGIKEGWTLEKMSRVLQTLTGVAASKANRLIRTETMAVYSKATKEMFLENGIEYVEIIGDAECGGICLDYVGGVVPLRDAELGGDLPPYHPNCACSFCSYVEFEDGTINQVGYKLEK